MYPSFTFGLLFYCFAVMTVTGEDLADGNCDKDGLVSNKVITLFSSSLLHSVGPSWQKSTSLFCLLATDSGA
jgi:hypothetical protein